MQNALNFLSKKGIEFEIIPDNREPVGDIVFRFAKRDEPCSSPNGEVRHNWCWRGTQPDVFLAIQSFISDVNTIMGTRRFEDWEHDYPTRELGREAYRRARQMETDVKRVFGDSWDDFCQIVDRDARAAACLDYSLI